MGLLQEGGMAGSKRAASKMETFLQRSIEFERMTAYARGQLDMLRYVIEREARCPCCGATFRHGLVEKEGSLLLLLMNKLQAREKSPHAATQTSGHEGRAGCLELKPLFDMDSAADLEEKVHLGASNGIQIPACILCKVDDIEAFIEGSG